MLLHQRGWRGAKSQKSIPNSNTSIESEAIGLGMRLSVDVVLLDERRGRQAARDRGLAVSGTLGVLDLADGRSLVHLADAIDRLKTTNFRASPRVLKRFGGAGNS